MKVYLFTDYLKTIHGEPLNDSQVICEIEPISDFPSGLVRINNKIATVCHIAKKEDFITIKFIDGMLNDDEVFHEDDITCPHCGSKVSDSWEYADSDDEHTCETCESVFSYERHIEVSYNSTIVKRNEAIKSMVKCEQ